MDTSGTKSELEGLIAGVVAAAKDVDFLTSNYSSLLGGARVELLRAPVVDLADKRASSLDVPAESGIGGVRGGLGDNQLTVSSNGDLARRSTVGNDIEVFASEIDLKRRNGNIALLKSKDDLVVSELEGFHAHGASARVETKGVLGMGLGLTRSRSSES